MASGRRGCRGMRGRSLFLAGGELDSDVDDHIFLTADHLALAELDQDVARRYAEFDRRPLREEQERRVDSGVSDRQAAAIDPRYVALPDNRVDDVFGDVHDLEQVDTALDTHP